MGKLIRADAPIIGINALRKIKPNAEISQTDVKLYAAGNKPLPVMRTADLNISLHEQYVLVTVIVVDTAKLSATNRPSR